MVDLYDMHQRQQIKGLRSQQSANEATNEIRHKRAAQQGEAIEERVERLLLITEAMWSLLEDTVGFTEAHLVHRMAELDAQDGSSDGRRGTRGEAPDCTGCGAKVSRQHGKCQFCGAPSAEVSAFDRV